MPVAVAESWGRAMNASEVIGEAERGCADRVEGEGAVGRGEQAGTVAELGGDVGQADPGGGVVGVTGGGAQEVGALGER